MKKKYIPVKHKIESLIDSGLSLSKIAEQEGIDRRRFHTLCKQYNIRTTKKD
ncbi:hypothetical protein QEF67_004348 [Klebsiella aerogenes]|uniref:hypothetical protein n=1 Tax=Klebsiella aerogenes TaxID=548 RepID=UPI000B052088|nr:hypothetical protein [Klebsiella aerogenes]EKT3983762.1 hypothetical protein [Klebsiella aerogenes]MCY4762691.1 hypothetical protein [Klebsiella aerogenes]MDT4308404.1 hypothetical protein [Klebsiella aerogenes]WPR92340.1 hypothetical protein SM909_17265 [Klebsiella aerogenes]HBT3063122.1 hypothetical protein [Klebsiella aerogenes]